VIASALMVQNINRIGIFSSLTETEIKQLLNYASYEEYKENQMIFSENDSGASLYIVVTGKVKIFRVLSDNTVHEISNFCDNEVFGEMAFLDNHVRSANAEALCETSLVKLSTKNFEQFSAAFPDAAFRFHKNLINEIQGRLRKTNDRYSYHIIWGKTMKTALAKNYEELLQSNIELSASRNFLDNLINSSSDVIMVINDDFEVIMFNAGAEKLLKYPASEIINRPVLKLFYDKAAFDAFTAAALADGVAGDREIELRTSDNRKIIADASIFRLSSDPDVKGFGDGLAIVARDITQKKVLENQLMQNEKMIFLGRAVSEIVHDIKNPLTIVQLTKDSIQMKCEGADCRRAEIVKELEFDFGKIDESVDRIQQIISNTLEYAKVVPGKKSRIDIAEAASKSIALAKINLKNWDPVTVNLNLTAGGPFYIDGNASQIEQVLVNLITNAIHAIKKGAEGKIDVDISSASGSVAVAVKDNGCGISEEDIQYIFEPFFTTKSEDKGTGLGLSICQAIISQHKGTIAVKSKVGEGTEFVLDFPLA